MKRIEIHKNNKTRSIIYIGKGTEFANTQRFRADYYINYMLDEEYYALTIDIFMSTIHQVISESTLLKNLSEADTVKVDEYKDV